jgi:hypothetical protein
MAAEQHTVDLNIHGLVRVRLLGAPARIAEDLESQLGPVLAPADDVAPDIVVRFEEPTIPPDFARIGRNFAGFGGGEFFVLDELSGRPVAQIPIDQIGERYEMVCSRSVRTVPLLLDAVIVTLWSKGLAPLHASAFVHEGIGVLVMGWPKGGKTGAMLTFMDDGAEYVGDEWVFIDPAAQIAYGLPLPIGISEWQWAQLPHLVPRRTAQQRLMFAAIHAVERFARWSGRTGLRRSPIVKTLQRGVPALRRQLKMSVRPGALFPGRIGAMSMRAERAFLVIDAAHPSIEVEPCDSEVVAGRMVHANLTEMQRILDYHRAHSFAFPDRTNPFLEQAVDKMKPSVVEALAATETFVVRHPYGGSLEALFHAMSPWASRRPPPGHAVSDE